MSDELTKKLEKLERRLNAIEGNDNVASEADQQPPATAQGTSSDDYEAQIAALQKALDEQRQELEALREERQQLAQERQQRQDSDLASWFPGHPEYVKRNNIFRHESE